MNDLLFRVGETKRLHHKVEADAAFTVTSVSLRIYDSAGDQITGSPFTGTASSGSETSHDVYYNWTPAAAGDYTYLLLYTVGSETRGIRGEVTVLPVTSKFDKWVKRVTDWMVESEVGEAQQLLSYRQLRDACLTAVRKFEESHPRRKLNDSAGETLSANTWEYALPADWSDEFSRIESFEYPVDADVQERPYLEPWEVEVDELRDKWYFVERVPTAGQKARFTYTLRHTLDDATDTIPTTRFDSVSMYAAGVALLQAANEACRKSDPQRGAGIVGQRTKQQEYSSQAKTLMDRAMDLWGRNRAAGAIGQMSYLSDHGRVWSL